MTFSPGTESASRDLVAQLSALLAAQLLALFAGKKSLILIHILLVLLHSNNVGQCTAR
jgi:hypothetical protein